MKCDMFKPSKTCECCTEYTCMILGGKTDPLDMCSCMCCANHGIHGDDEVCLVNNGIDKVRESNKMNNSVYDITNRIFDVLNNTKGFEVELTKPGEGKIAVNYNGADFTLALEPGTESSKKVCNCQQILQNITKELDGYYADAHNPEYSEDAQALYAQQYQLLVGSYDMVGYDIKRNSEGKHVVSIKTSVSGAEHTSVFSR